MAGMEGRLTENCSSDHVTSPMVIVGYSADTGHIGGDECCHLEQRLQVPEHEQNESGLQVDDEETHRVPGVARMSRWEAEPCLFHVGSIALAKATTCVDGIVDNPGETRAGTVELRDDGSADRDKMRPQSTDPPFADLCEAESDRYSQNEQ